MIGWFNTLDDRERMLVSVAVGFVVFAIVWFGVWSPLDSGQKSTAERVEIWKTSLAELRPLRGQIQSSGNQNAVANSNQSLVVIVDSSLRQRGLTNALQRSQPTPGGNGIRVEFENAAFDDLVLWLGDLHRQHALQVISSSFSVSSSDNQGRVNSTLTLER